MVKFYQGVELKVTRFGTVLALNWPGRLLGLK